jgi:hypothetical protein
VCLATAAVGGKHIGEKCWLEDVAASLGNEAVSVAWLEDALEHSYGHGQMEVLSYLEAIMEDVVLMMEMAARKRFSVG